MNKILKIGTFLIIVLLLAFVLYSRFWKEPIALYAKTDNPKLLKIRGDLEALKSELKEKGEYDCCIKNDCNWCLIYMGHCNCQKLVEEKGAEKSCPECAAAWNRKRGKITGVDPVFIPLNPATHSGDSGHPKN